MIFQSCRPADSSSTNSISTPKFKQEQRNIGDLKDNWTLLRQYKGGSSKLKVYCWLVRFI